MKPNISIIVPVYNVENYINRCIESLINQTLVNIEIILVDDGSQDNSGKICDEFSKIDKRIRVIHKKNEGLGMARNSGLSIARGEFVAYVDSDDYVSINMYENLYKLAKKNYADTVICGFKKINYEGEETSTESIISETKVFNGEDVSRKLLVRMIGTEPDCKSDIDISMSVWKGIYSNEIIKKNKIKFCSERTFISEDIIYHIDYLLTSNKVLLTNEKYYYYCENSYSLTKSYKKDRFDKEKILFAEIERKLINSNLFEISKLRMDRTFIGRYRTCIIHEVYCSKNIFDKIKKIKAICNDSKVRETIRNYPINELPIKQKIFALLTKYKLAAFIYLVARLN